MTQLVKYLASMQSAWVPCLVSNKPDVVAQAYNPRTWEMEARLSEVQAHS